MAADCLFCDIASGEAPADVVDQTDRWVAFRDINPQAPTHILIIPREHIPTLNHLDEDSSEVVGQLLHAAKELAAREGIDNEGYRVVVNTNAGAGQSVFHIHLHLLGGRPLKWPPG